MAFEKLRRRIVGPSTSLVTPMKKDYSLDLQGLRENIRYVLENGFTEGKGVLLAATPGGESPSMTIKERKRAMQVLADEAKGKIPIESTAHDLSQENVIEFLRYGKDLGFDLMQLQPPFYEGTSPDEVFRFYEGVTKAVDIGIMVYNTTWLGILGGVGVEMPLMERLSKLDGIVGFKWSSPSWYTYATGITKWKHRFVFVDNEYLGLGVMWGAQSYLDVMGQWWPQYPLERWKLLQKGDYTKVAEHLWKLELPYRLWQGEQGVNGAATLKLAMSLAGRPAGPTKPPYNTQFTEAQIDQLRQILLRAGVPGVKPAK
jgi:dihydrodipicolinate synthase/N-acetylneuraminate lyase